jgi:hypothetical protein
VNILSTRWQILRRITPALVFLLALIPAFPGEGSAGGRIRIVTENSVDHPDTSRFFAAFLDQLPGAGFSVALLAAGDPGSGGTGDNVRAALAARPGALVLLGPAALAAAVEPISAMAVAPALVFAGVPADEIPTGLPTERTAGLTAADLAGPLLSMLAAHGEGGRTGFLGPDTPAARDAALRLKEKMAPVPLPMTFAADAEAWRTAFQDIQDRCDRLILHDATPLFPGGMDGEAAWVADHTWAPTGAFHESMAPVSLLALAPDPMEAGRWAAETVRRFFSGGPGGDSSPVPAPAGQWDSARRARMLLHLGIAERLGLEMSVDEVEFADRILEFPRRPDGDAKD